MPVVVTVEVLVPVTLEPVVVCVSVPVVLEAVVVRVLVADVMVEVEVICVDVAVTDVVTVSDEVVVRVTDSVAVSDEVVVAVICEADVVVVPEARGQGICRQMLAALEGIARDRGCCKLTLEVLAGNEVARGVYARFGFAGYALDPVAGEALFWEKSL